MPAHKSPEEVEREHLRAFGPDLGPLYDALHNEVAWLHAKWQEYRKLYAESEERVDLLNSTAAFFFGVVQDALWDNVLLHICRLTDPTSHKGFEHLTLRRLPKVIPDKRLAREVRALVKNAEDRSEFARKLRNDRLAHLDLAVGLTDGVALLSGASRQQVEETLASFRAVLNKLHVFYLNGEVAFEHVHVTTGADTLVYHLDVAAKAEKAISESGS